MVNLINHSSEFMSELVAYYIEKHEVKAGFNAFFPRKTVKTKSIMLNVQRNGKPIAFDVQRCTDPVRREFSRSTEKIYVPPYFHEYFDLTQCEAFDRVNILGQDATMGDLSIISQSTKNNIDDIKQGFERAILKMQADILQFGFCIFRNHDTIDFRRKAQSMVTKTGAATWNNITTADPIADLKAGGEFLRSVGGSTGSTINAICGDSAISNILSNEKVLKLLDNRNINRVELGIPQMNEVSGFTFYGQLAAGDFIINLWSYNDDYEEVEGVSARYLNSENVVMIPSDFRGETAFAALNGVLNVDGKPKITVLEAEFTITDNVDCKRKVWEIAVDSAPLPYPITIDKIYTIKTQ